MRSVFATLPSCLPLPFHPYHRIAFPNGHCRATNRSEWSRWPSSADVKKGYRRSVDEQREQYERLIPALDKHGVTIGVQNHCDNFVTSAIGLVHAIGDFAPKHVGAVLDVAHCGLSGEPEAIAIDIAWPHLIMVNLKNGFRMRLNGPEAAQARWRTWWTTGRHGFASWPKTAAALQERGYTGPLCLSAEYTNPEGGDVVEDAVLPMIREDVELARSLFG